MSNTQGSILGLAKKAMTGSGMGSQKVVTKDGRTTAEEATFFTDLYKGDEKQIKERKKNAQKMVDTFYDLVTDFYESGWGQSFHFAPRGLSETFRESIARHEYYLAAKLGLSPGEKVLDLGCGIGGPMRNIVQFSGSDVTGVTINSYQVQRGNALNAKAKLDHLCRLEEMDFLNLKYEDNTFDKAFSIEATCHAPDRTPIFREAYRVLKPGALFASYEWVTTDKYDKNNILHKSAKNKIEKGNALPDLIPASESIRCLKEAGFELVLQQDVAEFGTENNQLPWYHSLESRFSLETLPHTSVGTFFTDWLCWTMEKVGLAPKGTHETHQFLLVGREGLVESGQMGTFTPMLLIMGRKPLHE